MFQSPKMTSAGKVLYYDSLVGSGLTFTTLQLGKGTISGPIAALTALVDPVITMPAVVSRHEGYADVSGSFSNAGLKEGFYWREIGLFAADPAYPDDRTKDVLFAYQNAYDTADFIPAASIETVEKQVTLPIMVDDAVQVSCTIDQSLVYASKAEIEAVKNSNNETAKEAADAKEAAASALKAAGNAQSTANTALQTAENKADANHLHSQYVTSDNASELLGGSLSPSDIGAAPASTVATMQQSLTSHTGNAAIHRASSGLRLTLTTAGWSGSGTSYTQTVSAAGVTTAGNEVVLVYPANKASRTLWQDNGIAANDIAQDGKLTFEAESKPTAAISVIVEVKDIGLT